MPEIEKNQNKPQTLEQWSQVLCDQEMPIFSNTANNIYNSLDDRKKGAMELASIILQDPNLTAKLLKVANSSFYNPSNQKMSTVSRAIVILGSSVVRELTIACSFFESIISAENKQRANEEIAHAIHAAVQAKEIAIILKDPSPEEVFIAALLNNIGKIAFWCFGGKPCQYIRELVQSNQFSASEAEKHVLGFSLSELGKELSRSWKFGGLIEEAINNPASSNTRVQSVQLGNEISTAISAGWDSENMKHCLKKMESLTGLDQNNIKSLFKKNIDSAVNIAKKFGAHDASRFIQSDSNKSQPQQVNDDIVDKKQIQVHILQDITNHISGSINLNLLFEMVIEGIHRGISMDRTLFCLLNSDKNTLNEKLSLGWLKKLNAEKIKLELSKMPVNLYFNAMNNLNGIWVKPEVDSALFTPHVINTIGKTECFLIPIYSDNKPIGLIYTDRSINHQPLTEEDFKTTKHFAQQANIGLSLFKIKK